MKLEASLVAEARAERPHLREAESLARLQLAGRFVAVCLPAWAVLVDGRRPWFESAV